MNLVKIVWNIPNTIFGLVALVVFYLLGEIESIFICEGAIICSLHAQTKKKLFSNNMGITLGNIVFMPAIRISNKKLVAHEIAHVRQSEMLGVFYFPFYVVCYAIIALIKQGDPKFDNPLEIMARRSAGQIIDILGVVQKIKQK